MTCPKIGRIAGLGQGQGVGRKGVLPVGPGTRNAWQLRKGVRSLCRLNHVEQLLDDNSLWVEPT